MPRHALTWSRTFRIWLSIVLQSLLNTVFVAVVVGVPAAVLTEAAGWFSAEAARAIAWITTPLVYLASMLWGVRIALEKEYADFWLEVVDRTPIARELEP
jgi:hypothetical protein